MRNKVINKRYLPLSFSKYNETSPKLVYFQETRGTVISEKIQLILMQNGKVFSESRQVVHRKSHCQAKWVKSWAS